MSQQARLDSITTQHRDKFVEAARQLASHDSWSLSVPAVIVDARKNPGTATVHPIGTLGSVIPTSAAIDSPELKRWIEIADKHGPEAAFDEVLNSDDGEAFSEAYEQLRTERREGIKGLWSASDLSRFVVKTREAHPNSVGAVVILKTDEEPRHQILTFESDVRELLS